LALILSQK